MYAGKVRVMTENGYKAGTNLEKILAAGKFAVTGECGPPKSADGSVIEKKAKLLKGYVDAVNITDNQTAVVRVCSIASGYTAQQNGVEADHADDLPRPEPSGDAGRHPRRPHARHPEHASASPATT